MNVFPVFVYGTLKAGLRNNRLLVRNGATYVREATTVDQFTMNDVGFPLIIKSRAVKPSQWAAPVKGEIYLVSEECVQDLDQLESEGEMYARTMIQLTDGSQAAAYIWIGEAEGNKYRPVDGVLDWTDSWRNDSL